MESFFWEKCGREKWKRRAYLFLREALTPSVGSSIWDGQDNMLVRTVKKSKLFRREIGEDSNWKKIILFGRHDFSQFSFKRKITSWCEWQDFSLAPLWLALVGPLSGGNVTKSCNLSLSDPSATSDKTSWPHNLTPSTFQKGNDDIQINKINKPVQPVIVYSPQSKFVAGFFSTQKNTKITTKSFWTASKELLVKLCKHSDPLLSAHSGRIRESTKQILQQLHNNIPYLHTFSVTTKFGYLDESSEKHQTAFEIYDKI